MDKKIPIYFDNAVIVSPLEPISNTSGIGRLKVGVFTRYGNRNGSYIKDSVADMLIKSAIQGDTPVIGFFDPESKSWAGHTGPTLANAYGYVEGFEGWELFTDSDSIQREYAVFSIVLFTRYFEEANFVVGQHQSMELDINSIEGDWADINGTEYFVYTKAAIMGLCIIGSHEPCFSASTFFEKVDENYKSQYEKFSSLLFDLKTQVEEAEKIKEGGEQPMNEFEKETLVNEEVVDPQVQTEEVVDTFEEAPAVEEETKVEETTEPEVQFEEVTEVETTVEVEVSAEEETAESSDFELLQTQFNELQDSYNQLQENLTTAQARIEELEAFQNTANTELETLRATNQTLEASLQKYETEAAAVENTRKEELVEKYEKILTEEEISPIKTMINDFSYDELESKLAITFANKQMTGGEVKKVPLPDPEQTQFALFMEKYRKN